MSDQLEQAPLRPFEADGIQELDNNLPGWWVGLFVFNVIFAALYMVYMHLFGGPSIQQEYVTSLAQAPKVSASNTNDGDQEPTDLNALMAHGGAIKSGKETYLANCAPCHGQVGEGTIGPNLTDKFWLHGGKPDQIYKTIFEGVPLKGMPAWGPVVGEKKSRHLTAFIVSLKGTNPPNAKAPQGNPEE